MTAYYNEIEPYAAQWLRNLIAAGHIAPGEVDERSIEDVKPEEIREFTQCHFFAGVGIWSAALRRAGWPDDRHIWTGSCPCQPFSAAGKGGGFDDKRHLWPHWHWLIEQLQPRAVFGEQVASKDGLGWFDLVSADMEGTGYAIAPIDFCAAGVGAPHLRQRLYFVAEKLADSNQPRPQGWVERWDGADKQSLGERGLVGVMDVSESERRCGNGPSGDEWACQESGGPDIYGVVADADSAGRIKGVETASPARHGHTADSDGRYGRSLPTNGHWRNADWLHCTDGRWRAVEPGTFPLVNGATQRMGRLRAYGNGLVLEAAQKYIESYMEGRP